MIIETYGIETVVDNMFQIFAHPDLFHQLVLVAIHARQLSNMSKHVLQTISQLEGIHIVQAVLHVRIHNQFGQPQNLPAQMESVAKSGFFTLFGRQSLDRFQVEIVIQMQVVEIFAVNQQIQHVVTLSTDLKSDLDPIQGCRLEKFGGLEGSEQVPLLLRFGWSVMQSVQDIVLEQLLVTDPDLDRLSWRTMFTVPSFNQRYVQSSATPSGSQVERPGRPKELDTISGVVCVQRTILQKWLGSLV